MLAWGTLLEKEGEGGKKRTEKPHKPHNTHKLILKAALENALKVQVLEQQVAFGHCKAWTAFNAIPNSRMILCFILLAVSRLLHCNRKSPLIPCGSTILAAKLNVCRLSIPTPATGVIAFSFCFLLPSETGPQLCQASVFQIPVSTEQKGRVF